MITNSTRTSTARVTTSNSDSSNTSSLDSYLQSNSLEYLRSQIKILF